ncbi:MAG: TIGR04086 family membrane protein [Ruminococcaceae bacterium]|nr:TIGR04086 family membrane protein [Oscillospiraceae bacterium]
MNRMLLISSLKGAALGLIAAISLLLLLNGLAMQAADPDRLVPLLSHIAQGLGAWIAGLATARFLKEKSASAGALAGGFFAIVILLGAAFTDGAFSFLTAIIVCLALVALGTVGGCLGKPKRAGHAARRRAMMKRMG